MATLVLASPREMQEQHHGRMIGRSCLFFVIVDLVRTDLARVFGTGQRPVFGTVAAETAERDRDAVEMAAVATMQLDDSDSG
jgi:hypothetical protein